MKKKLTTDTGWMKKKGNEGFGEIRNLDGTVPPEYRGLENPKGTKPEIMPKEKERPIPKTKKQDKNFRKYSNTRFA